MVGRIGKYLAEGSGFGHKLMYFELNDEKPEKEAIKDIAEFIKNYEKVFKKFCVYLFGRNIVCVW